MFKTKDISIQIKIGKVVLTQAVVSSMFTIAR